MYSKCCVPGCVSSRHDIILHKFPKCEKRLQVWLKSINCDSLRRKSIKILQGLQVCQKHFEARFITRNSRIHSKAYPTLFLESEIFCGIPKNPILTVDTHIVEHGYVRTRHNDHNYCLREEPHINKEMDVSASLPSTSAALNVVDETTHSPGMNIVNETPHSPGINMVDETPQSPVINMVDETPHSPVINMVDETPHSPGINMVDEKPNCPGINMVVETPHFPVINMVDETPHSPGINMVDEKPNCPGINMVDETPHCPGINMVDEIPHCPGINMVVETPHSLDINMVDVTPDCPGVLPPETMATIVQEDAQKRLQFTSPCAEITSLETAATFVSEDFEELLQFTFPCAGLFPPERTATNIPVDNPEMLQSTTQCPGVLPPETPTTFMQAYVQEMLQPTYQYSEVLPSVTVPSVLQDAVKETMKSTSQCCELSKKKRLNVKSLSPMCRELYNKYRRLQKLLSFTRKAKRDLQDKRKCYEELLAGMKPLGKKLIMMQIRLCKEKEKARRFTDEEKLISLSIFNQGLKSYQILQNIFILPSITTLKKLNAQIQINAGMDS